MMCAAPAQMAMASSAPKSNLKYEDLVSKQSADGSWSLDLLELIMSYVPN